MVISLKIGIGLIFIVENWYRQGLELDDWLKSVSVRIGYKESVYPYLVVVWLWYSI